MHLEFLTFEPILILQSKKVVLYFKDFVLISEVFIGPENEAGNSNLTFGAI